MPKDRLERKTYRKSPGRQYGYEYDPLRSRTERTQGGQTDKAIYGESRPAQGEMSSRPDAALVQRPDPRRTRQLLRQNILASKTRFADEDEDQEEAQDVERMHNVPTEVDPPNASSSRMRYAMQSAALGKPRVPSPREASEEADEWRDFENVDPDAGYEEDPLDVRLGYSAASGRSAVNRQMASTRRQHHPEPVEYEDDYEEEEYEEEEPQARRKPGKRKLSRRGLLAGAGLVAVGGVGLAAYEFGPKIPQALGNAEANIEHQLQDAFNKGLQQGADAARKEFVTALDNLEGFSLEAAVNAARLTRVAYDVFVSPVIEFGSTITGDILTGMLRALKTARGWLAGAYQDNNTLAAIQKVLESWVGQVSTMPKQLNAITQTDLDGAQAYLRALQRKIQAEKDTLNGKTQPAASPTQKSQK